MKMSTHIYGGMLRALMLAVPLAIASGSIVAKPAIKGYHDVKQPDGSMLKVRMIGDERGHFILTEDGYALMQNDQGEYVYAEIKADGERIATQTAAHNPADRNIKEKALLAKIGVPDINAICDQMESTRKATRGPGLYSSTYPTTGDQRSLVILVNFTDVKFDDKNDAEYKYSTYTSSANPAHAYWTDLMGKQGFNAFGGTGCVRDWFLDNSRDENGVSQFRPTFDLYGPVELPHTASYYGSNNSYGVDSRAYEMVIDACKLLDNEIDYTVYDRNGDGYVDNVYIFYAGLGEADYGGADTVWPHSWELSSGYKQFKLDGVTIDRYACSNETDNFARRPDGIGTFVHEFSHVLGLPDLYQTNDGTDCLTPGAYDIMDYGPYNNNSRTPPNYSAFERYALDWLKPQTFGVSDVYSLQHIADTNKAFIVHTDKEREYFLLECRRTKGWDRFIPGNGMLIWHIDYKKSVFTSNTVNNTKNHQYVDLIEANDRMERAYPFPGAIGVTDYAFSSWSGQDCMIALSEIADDGENITMRVANSDPNAAVDGIVMDEWTAAPEYYTLQGVRVAEPQAGQLLIRRSGSKAEKIIF